MADWSIARAGWGVMVLGWLLSPVISLLVNKLVACLLSDVSRKYWRFERFTVPDLKEMLRNVLEQRMQRTMEYRESPSDLEPLVKVEEDLKAALDEAEDIIDTVKYHQTEEEVLGHGSSRWVQCRLAAGGAYIASSFWWSWFMLGRWIDVTRAALLQSALSLYQLGRIVIHVLAQRAQSLCQRLQGQFRVATTSGPILPVSIETSISGSGGSMPGASGIFSSTSTSLTSFHVTEDAARELRPSEKVVEEEGEENVEEEENIEEKVEEEEQVKEEAESEQEGATCFEVAEVKDEEKLKKNGALYCCIRHFLQSMLICLSNAIVFARSKRDWSYEAVGIKSNQKGSAAEYFPTLGTNSLRKRIEHIENILNDTKKSHLLNQQSSSIEITKKDNNNGRSSSEIPGKDTKNEGTSSRQEQIDDWYRKIKMEQKVFGRDKEVDDICGLFRKRPFGQSSKPYSVFGIHGISGSGKSTLANYICDHEKKVDDKHFDLIVFTHVSVTFRVEKIFRDMLREMEITGTESMDIVRLGKELMKNLEGRRFLLVLDDLWVKGENQMERDILLRALRAGRNGSIILVTAQNEDAAKTLGAQEQERMRIADLEEKVYLSLFMHHAEVDDDKRILFERIGAKIAERLHRSPIAAVAVARRLQPEKCPSKWEEKARELDVLNETMGALWWSYQQLGVDTRRCFEYCSTFPRGYELKRDELVRMWIAQGYVNTTMSNTSEELEDVGQRYIDELLKFSFLQVREETWRGKYITIHDLLHELAGKVAGSDFFRIELNSLQKDILPGVRHLFIETENVAEIAEKNQDLGNLRTLIIEEHHKDSDRLEAVKGVKISHEWEKIFECLLMRLRKLRVLIVKSDRNKELLLPELIHQLKHLRYFQFDSPGWRVILPSTFSKLYHMQTIEGSIYMSYPQGMANLIHLRHISGTPHFPNVGRLKSLQTMQYFFVWERQGHDLKQLKPLNKLRGTLWIGGLGYVGSKEEAQEADLASKKHIRKLKLDFFGDSEMSRDAEVLEGLCPPKDLEELKISNFRGSTYPSWMLSGQHPDAPKDLRKLEFQFCSFPLASIPEDSEFFVRLHELKIGYCDWDSLPENMVQIVSLQSLTISHCSKMELLPTLPPSLEEISIVWCDVLSRTCKVEGHQNSQKIQHIPRKNIKERILPCAICGRPQWCHLQCCPGNAGC